MKAGADYTHICGTDLIRDKDGNYLVLEDNDDFLDPLSVRPDTALGVPGCE